jgi:formiminoglutamate deiminase
MTRTAYFADHAWLPDGLASGVRIVVADGRFETVQAGSAPQGGDERLPGLVLAGFANTHSHAFHRALRGRTHDDGGTFWTWRERMYSVATRLDPDSYLALARATYAEMALAGVTSVGEFHYLHHGPGGVPYDDPNEMGRALIQAAAEAGIRITLLDACYLAGGLDASGHLPLEGPQLRFGDGTGAAWAGRVSALGDVGPGALVGSAIHSVRAVPLDDLADVSDADRLRPMHFHLSEQRAENDQCLAYYGVTPTRLLLDSQVLDAPATAVHATRVTASDIADLGASHTSISMCPTTERDLADGIGPAYLLAHRLADASAPIVLGSDQHAVIDLLEEARALEMDERLASGKRGRFSIAELTTALTGAGQASLGWADAGRIEVGARADLVAVRLDTVRTAGTDPGQAILAATASDIDTVIVDGRVVVRAGVHVLGDVGALLSAAITPLWTG